MHSTAAASDTPTEEIELVARLQSGDAGAFETLVRSYGPRMLAIARRYLHHDEEAQDALQDALLSVYRGIHRFEGNSQLATWLHRIAANAALMRLRRRRIDETSIDDLLPKFVDDGHQVQPTVPWTKSVEAALEQLPDQHRAILLLRDIEQRDTEETAELLGLTIGAVKTRLHRARQALRTLLDSHMQGET
jgi:RNA polymerase sigma-70 factor (ECF subfamily)